MYECCFLIGTALIVASVINFCDCVPGVKYRKKRKGCWWRFNGKMDSAVACHQIGPGTVHGEKGHHFSPNFSW